MQPIVDDFLVDYNTPHDRHIMTTYGKVKGRVAVKDQPATIPILMQVEAIIHPTDVVGLGCLLGYSE